jgi:hypothetical protein
MFAAPMSLMHCSLALVFIRTILDIIHMAHIATTTAIARFPKWQLVHV